MKNVLFATTALAGLAIGGVASAQGIALFGDARLGLGYNINNEGGVLTEFDDEGNVSTPDDVRAISRVRFGVNMTGETDSGITFGATIRADNAQGGQGGTNGQTAGSVFVSGSWGTLTYGDTNAADEQWVGDVPGDYSVTGLGELDETRFVSNGGDFGADSGASFANNPFARPTIRYDFDIMGFGVSASSNRDLTDITVGTGYSADFGGGSWSIGAGYNSFEEFTETGDIGAVEVCGPEGVDVDGECIDTVLVNGADVVVSEFPAGEQWSVGLDAAYEAFGFGATWVSLSTDDNADGLDTNADNLLVGASFGWNAWSFGAVFGHIMSAGGTLEPIDGNSSYEFSAQYDLGGGASFNAGVRQTYNLFNEDGTEGDSATIGDLGIVMSF